MFHIDYICVIIMIFLIFFYLIIRAFLHIYWNL